MNCVICGQPQCCFRDPGLCFEHYREVNADLYRWEHYTAWRAVGCTGTTTGFASSLVPNPAPFPVDHQCEDAVHRGVSSLCRNPYCGASGDGRAVCSSCEPLCPGCGMCGECSVRCDEVAGYCCSCADDHHCNQCNSVIWESNCENGFLCDSCCDCHVEEENEDDGEDDRGLRRYAETPSYNLIDTWQTIKELYIGECAKCVNSMISCTCIDY